MPPSLPKTSLSKRRKVDTGCRVVQEKWTTSSLFTEEDCKPVCLVCMQKGSVLGDAHNGEKYNSLFFTQAQRICCIES